MKLGLYPGELISPLIAPSRGKLPLTMLSRDWRDFILPSGVRAHATPELPFLSACVPVRLVGGGLSCWTRRARAPREVHRSKQYSLPVTFV